MTRQGRKTQETLEEYLCSIDNGEENLKLYCELKIMSNVSEEAKMFYQQARIAQMLFYEGLIAQRKPIIEESLLKEFSKINSEEPKFQDIWSYFNYLLVEAKCNWKTVLTTVGMDTKLSKSFSEQNMNLERVSPTILAKIGRLLGAQPNLLLEFSYKWFLQERETEYSAVSYRVLNSCMLLSDSADEPAASYYNYIEELHNQLL